MTSIEDGTFDGCYSLMSIDIPNSVNSIGILAFNHCSGLTSVTIGNSVAIIGDYAFRDCTGLISVAIPNSVTSIGNRAFDGCYSLTSVTIGSSVTSIGYRAFYRCSQLTSVDIPNSVTSIDYGAFEGCSSLMEVKSLIESPYEIEDRVFSYETYQQGTLYIPKGTMSLYTSLDGWRKFQNIVEMSEDDILNNIQLANSNSEKACVEVEEGGIRIHNASEGTLCQVFSADGKLLKSFKLTEGTQYIGLPGSQMYIVKVGDKTIKVAL